MASGIATETLNVGVIGARGYAGAELIRLIGSHPQLELTFASSRRLVGQEITEFAPTAPAGMRYIDVPPDDVADFGSDVLVLALPDGASDAYLSSIASAEDGGPVVIDLSADRRFDDGWVYGLPERNAEAIRKSRRISNPGCYATAMQLTILPMLDALDGEPHCFGVSGYSGAGTAPSERNDPALLKHAILPYKLVGHTHEREVTKQIETSVRFIPHVAPFSRGISLTTTMTLREPTSLDDLAGSFHAFYGGHPLVRILDGEMPLIRDVVGFNGAILGGFAVDPEDSRRIAVVCVLDNLLKGASSQALQNINLAIGCDACTGLEI